MEGIKDMTYYNAEKDRSTNWQNTSGVIQKMFSMKFREFSTIIENKGIVMKKNYHINLCNVLQEMKMGYYLPNLSL